MPAEFFWLTLTLAMTGLFWVPYILDRIVTQGLMAALGYPDARTTPQSAWAQRQVKAHTNAIENLAVFAPLVLVAHALSISTPATVFAAALYFWARLAHFVLYTLKVPVLRTLAFVGGFAAQAIFVLAIFKLN